MEINDFKLEAYFNQYEFTAPYSLCQSDCESYTIQELLDLEPGAEGRLKNSWLGYTEVEGAPELRREIAKLYDKIEANEILVHVGAEEGIFNFMNVVLKPGDHVIVQCPAYQSLYEIAESIGCQVSKWKIRQGETGWVLDPDELRGLIRANTKLIVINSPHNPTGHSFNLGELKRLAEIAREKDIVVFSDEVYKGLEYASEDRLPWFADLYEHAVSLGVMSKAYGMAGLRIGWIATKNQELYNRMVHFKHYTSICNSAPSEFLASVALRHGEQILNRNREIIRVNLQLTEEVFSRYPSLFVHNRPNSGPIAFHRVKSPSSATEFCMDLLAKKGVLLLPGTVYDYDESYFRMGYGRQNFKEGLEKLEEYLSESHRI